MLKQVRVKSFTGVNDIVFKDENKSTLAARHFVHSGLFEKEYNLSEGEVLVGV